MGRRPFPPTRAAGSHIGSPEHIQAHLQQVFAQHVPLLQHLPHLEDLQASWLALLYTASPRSYFLLHMLPPNVTAQFAQQHDTAITTCLAVLLESSNFPIDAIARAHLPLAARGLGFLQHLSLPQPHFGPPGCYSSNSQHWQPLRAAALTHIAAADQARHAIQEQGWDPPSWDQLAASRRRPQGTEDIFSRPAQPGWQRHASTPLHTAARAELYHTFDPPAQAMLDSQAGPFSSRAFTTIPLAPSPATAPF